MSSIIILSCIALYFSLLFLISYLTGKNDSNERVGGTVSSCIYAILQGVQILRVHDVNEINQAMKVFNKLIFN